MLSEDFQPHCFVIVCISWKSDIYTFLTTSQGFQKSFSSTNLWTFVAALVEKQDINNLKQTEIAQISTDKNDSQIGGLEGLLKGST